MTKRSKQTSPNTWKRNPITAPTPPQYPSRRMNHQPMKAGIIPVMK